MALLPRRLRGRPATAPPRTLLAALPDALVAALLLATTSACNLTLLAPATRNPIPSEILRPVAAGSDCLAVLLPGRWNRMAAFSKAGFADRAEVAGVDLGLLAVDAHIGYYRDEILVPRLEQDVIEPARTRPGGAQRIWLVGTSLGAVGSLIYWREHPDEIDGLVLIAPYLGEDTTGEDDVLDEIRRVGSLQQWTPDRPLTDDDFVRRIWLTLRDATAPGSTIPVLLAYGTRDDLAPGHRLLARELPETHVFTRDGGHDWGTWAELWSDVLASGLVCGRR
ncbi:MAG: alpha/beta hydrolase [Acidobacteriota bacterium]|jgi:hypothetical protein